MFFRVDSVGRSGGLALLWNDHFSVEIQNFSRRYVNAIVGLDGMDMYRSSLSFMETLSHERELRVGIFFNTLIRFP